MPPIRGNAWAPDQVRSASAHKDLLQRSTSSSEMDCPALTLCRSVSASIRNASASRPTLRVSSTSACATTSRSERLRLSEALPEVELGVSSPSIVLRNSSNFSNESGSTTPAPERFVPRFMKLPTAKQVLMHLRSNSVSRNAWQHLLTVAAALLKSLISRAGPTISAPHASFSAHWGTAPNTRRYRSGKSRRSRSVTCMSI
mmetsp:Transcript_91945/g.259757  ORF Transcript_91945/g.259757 Transcript_91945/m.259757 type:complete len:201 (+) Transcript_91945:781-1383(+)